MMIFLTRAKIECSSAVSLPSAELQIIGNKTFQIKYKDKDYLRKFLSEEDINKIYEHFGEFKKIEDFKDNDENKFVLKSLNEGGGNNLYKEDIKKYLSEVQKENNYFMMKLIEGKKHQNCLLDGKERSIIPEIGIFGFLFSKDGKVIYNESGGYICRSKDSLANECGVSCGFGFLDSIADE